LDKENTYSKNIGAIMQPHQRVSQASHASSAQILSQLQAMLYNSANINVAQLCTDIQQIENLEEKIAIYLQFKWCIHYLQLQSNFSVAIEQLEQPLQKELCEYLSTLLMKEMSDSDENLRFIVARIEKEEELIEQYLLQKEYINYFLASIAASQEGLAAFLHKQSLSQMLNIYKYRSLVSAIINNKDNFKPVDEKNNLLKELEITPILLYQVIANLSNKGKENLLIDKLFPVHVLMSHHLIKIMYQYAKQKGMLNSTDKANFIATNLQYILGCDSFIYKAVSSMDFDDMFPYITFKQLSEITRKEDKEMISAIYANSSSPYVVSQFLRTINQYHPQDQPLISLIDILQVNHEYLNIIFGYKTMGMMSPLYRIQSLMEHGLFSFEDLHKINHEELEKIINGDKCLALIFIMENKHYSKSELANLFNSDPELKQEIDALSVMMNAHDRDNKWMQVREKLEALPLSQEFIAKVNNGPYKDFNDKDDIALINEIMKIENRHKIFEAHRSDNGRIERINQDFLDFLQTRPAAYIEAVLHSLKRHHIMISPYIYKITDTARKQLDNLDRWIEWDKRVNNQHKPLKFN